MITVDAAALRDLLAGTVTGGKNDPEGFRYALFSVEGGTLRVTTTDSQATVVAEMPAKGDMQPLAIECATLRGLLNGMAGEMHIEPELPRCKVRCGASRYHVNTMEAEKFPNIDHLEATAVEFDPVAFKDAIETVKYAAGRNHPQAVYNGIHVLQNQVVATSGVQLAMAPVPVALGDDQVAILPTVSLPHIVARLSDGATFELMSSALGVVAARFGTPANSVTVALIASKKLNFARATNNGNEFEVSINTAELKPRTERISPFCKNGKIEFATREGRLHLKSHDSQAMEVIDCLELGGDIDAILSDMLLSGVLSRANGATMRWHGQNEADVARPHLFTFDGRSDEHYISPVRR